MVMMTIFKTLIQSKLDYCSQLWSPSDQSSIQRLESTFKNFTSQIAGFEDLDYWDRLLALRQYSQERRRERYRIIFIWKVLQGLVEGYPIASYTSIRRGRLVEVSKFRSDAPSSVRKAREDSLSVHGARLFNLIPQHLRDMKTGSVDHFKLGLSAVPDQPTVQVRQRAARTNSLLDQAVYAAVYL